MMNNNSNIANNTATTIAADSERRCPPRPAAAQTSTRADATSRRHASADADYWGHDAALNKLCSRKHGAPAARRTSAAQSSTNKSDPTLDAKATDAAAPPSKDPPVCLHSVANPVVAYMVPRSALISPLPPTTAAATPLYQLCPSCERRGGGSAKSKRGASAPSTTTTTAAAAAAECAGKGDCPYVHADIHGSPPQRPHITHAAATLNCYARLPTGGTPFTMRLPAEYPTAYASGDRLVSCTPDTVLVTRAVRHLLPLACDTAGEARAPPTKKSTGCVDEEGHPIGCPHFMTEGRCERGDRCRFVHLTARLNGAGSTATVLPPPRRRRRHDPYAAVPIRVVTAAVDRDDPAMLAGIALC